LGVASIAARRDCDRAVRGASGLARLKGESICGILCHSLGP